MGVLLRTGVNGQQSRTIPYHATMNDCSTFYGSFAPIGLWGCKAPIALQAQQIHRLIRQKSANTWSLTLTSLRGHALCFPPRVLELQLPFTEQLSTSVTLCGSLCHPIRSVAGWARSGSNEKMIGHANLQRENFNGSQLRALVDSQPLRAVNTFYQVGHTWPCPLGTTSRIDYVVLPASLQVYTCRALRSALELQLIPSPGRRDHKPVQVVFKHVLAYSASSCLHQVQWDRDRMARCLLYGQGRDGFLRAVEEACSSVSWPSSESPDREWASLNEVVTSAARTSFEQHSGETHKYVHPQDTQDAFQAMVTARTALVAQPEYRVFRLDRGAPMHHDLPMLLQRWRLVASDVSVDSMTSCANVTACRKRLDYLGSFSVIGREGSYRSCGALRADCQGGLLDQSAVGMMRRFVHNRTLMNGIHSSDNLGLMAGLAQFQCVLTAGFMPLSQIPLLLWHHMLKQKAWLKQTCVTWAGISKNNSCERLCLPGVFRQRYGASLCIRTGVFAGQNLGWVLWSLVPQHFGSGIAHPHACSAVFSRDLGVANKFWAQTGQGEWQARLRCSSGGQLSGSYGQGILHSRMEKRASTICTALCQWL